MGTHQIVLLCAEKDPLVCHRTILVSRNLVAQDVNLLHILETGVIESHDVAVERLLKELDLRDDDLLRSHSEIIKEAYNRHGNQIAYVLSANSEERTTKG